MNKKEKKQSPVVLYLGSKGFPFGSATVQRQLEISKALKLVGFHVVVLNRRSGHSKEIAKREQIEKHNFFQGIEYYYVSLVSYRPDNYVFRNINRLIGYLNEFLLLVYFSVFRNAKYIFCRSENIKTLQYYFYISRILRMELIYDYVELYDAMGKRDLFSLENLEFKFDNKFLQYTDKVVVISKYLEKHVKKIDPKKRIFKIPPIIDFDTFNTEYQQTHSTPYFLFCGNVGYIDLLYFIIEAYELSEARFKNVMLELVLNGDQNEIEKIQNLIENKKLNQYIFIKSNLSYTDLVQHYKNALALLIPILNNIQDQARVPYKICEYAAAGRPIITMETETMLSYFENGKDALLCNLNSKDDYVEYLNFVCNNREKSDEIGLNGYIKGKDIFNYVSYSKGLKDFLSQ